MSRVHLSIFTDEINPDPVRALGLAAAWGISDEFEPIDDDLDGLEANSRRNLEFVRAHLRG